MNISNWRTLKSCFCSVCLVCCRFCFFLIESHLSGYAFSSGFCLVSLVTFISSKLIFSLVVSGSFRSLTSGAVAHLLLRWSVTVCQSCQVSSHNQVWRLDLTFCFNLKWPSSFFDPDPNFLSVGLSPSSCCWPAGPDWVSPVVTYK